MQSKSISERKYKLLQSSTNISSFSHGFEGLLITKAAIVKFFEKKSNDSASASDVSSGADFCLSEFS